MHRYAQIDETGRCGAILESPTVIDAPHMIPRESVDVSLLGQIYDAGTDTFAPPAAPVRPAIVITSIEATPSEGLLVVGAEVTCAMDTVLTVHAELRAPGGAVLPLTDRFRMPLRSRDGREKVVLAEMTAGIITITVPLRESGRWAVTEAMINEALPPAAQMDFGGITIYVVEA